jgi:hypothetical protein
MDSPPKPAYPWPQIKAGLMLTGLLVLFLAALGISLWAPPPTATETSAAPGGADLVLYRHIVERVRGGEDYYAAAFAELQAGRYPTQSIFNWRLPTNAWLLALLPPRAGQFLLGGLALLALGLTFASEVKLGSVGSAAVVVVLLVGVLVWCIDGEAYLAHEVWAGVLLTIALACYYLDRPWLGFLVAAAALFLRELVLPFTVVAAWQAWRNARPREGLAWFAVWGAFAAFWAWHALNVRALATISDLQPAESWLAWGGLGFVLRTVQMNQWLINLPLWVAAVYFNVSLAGLLTWTGSKGQLSALTVLLYAGAFLIVGKPFNTYWGLLYAPVLPFGLVRAPKALVQLLTRRASNGPVNPLC